MSRRVVLISIDGMVPATYLAPDEHGLAVPNLRRLAASGASARAVESVFPSVTYPSHTTIATGQPPAVHGITTNRSLDPLEKNDGGWRWYAEDIAAPTLWARVEASGRAAALVSWPVTVGADVHYNVPEVWRSGTADDVKLVRALTKPSGLLERVASRFPTFADNFTPPDIRDRANADVAELLIREHGPDLVMVHMWWVDEMQHRHGLWSEPAKAAIEEADAQVGRLIRAAEESGHGERTVFVIASDHGFAPFERVVGPGVVLANAGLIELDESGAITDWTCSTSVDGGIAYVYLNPNGGTPADAMRAQRLFREMASRPASSGIAKVFDAGEIASRGGDPTALFAVEAAPGFALRGGVSGEVIGPGKNAATHGYDPKRDAMKASLVIAGPGVERRDLGDVRLEDIAPTIADILGLAPVASAGANLLASPQRTP